MRTIKFVRSTRRRIRGRVDTSQIGRVQRRPLVGAALLLLPMLALTAIACDGAKRQPVATASATSAATEAAPTPSRPVELSSLIDTRADLTRNDPIALAARYGRTQGRAPASIPFAGERKIGDARAFFVLNITGASGPPPVVSTVTASLLATTEHAYFYVDDALGVAAENVRLSADAFESETWPAVTGVFGAPPSPGVDGDPRIVVLLADLGSVGGYHSSDDLYVLAVRPLSNEAEMVYIDSSNAAGSRSFDVVLAHELQHLIHEHNDGDEEAWVNEGLSITAEGLVGGAMLTVDAFEERPATQLNRWEFGGNLPHYGAGAAFFRYLADRIGGDADLGRIAKEVGDGPAGVDEFLASASAGLSFRDVFADWIAANVLNRADGPFGNPARPVDIVVERSLAAGEAAEAAANQFGADYYELSGVSAGEYVLRFDGEPQVDVLPISPDDGGAFFWSNRGDGINTTLTREIDVPDNPGQAVSFDSWYDIERYYDRGYVSVSTDGGASWRALPATSTITDDPVQLAYGPGFEGRSGDPVEPQWIEERGDLTEFRGKKILLRFEYVTDGGTHGEGWAIRNFAYTDYDDIGPLPDDGWTADGWVRIDRALPQAYVVRVIGEREDSRPVVLDVKLDAQGDGVLRFSADGVRNLVVAVAGVTEGTVQRAPYTIELAGE